MASHVAMVTVLLLVMLPSMLSAALHPQGPPMDPFAAPDFGIQHQTDDGRTQLLAAYKIANANGPRWVSHGYPVVVKDTDGTALKYTDSSISFVVKLLDQKQVERLVQAAQNMYKDESITSDNFSPVQLILPTVQFWCEISFEVEKNYKLKGSAERVTIDPFPVVFRAKETSEKRRAFEEYLQKLAGAKSYIETECTFAATSKDAQIEEFKYTPLETEESGLIGKLFPDNEKPQIYIMRNQFRSFSNATAMIMKKLENEATLDLVGEFDLDAFIKTFENELQALSSSSFQYQQIKDWKFEQYDDVSSYGMETKLKGSDILAKLNQIFEISNSKGPHGKKTFVKTGGALEWINWFHLKPITEFVKSKQSEWKEDATTIDQQIAAINEISMNATGIEWKKQGYQLVADRVELAMITRQAFSANVTFPHMKKRLVNPALSTQFVVTIPVKGMETKKPTTAPEETMTASLGSVPKGNDSPSKSALSKATPSHTTPNTQHQGSSSTKRTTGSSMQSIAISSSIGPSYSTSGDNDSNLNRDSSSGAIGLLHKRSMIARVSVLVLVIFIVRGST